MRFSSLPCVPPCSVRLHGDLEVLPSAPCSQTPLACTQNYWVSALFPSYSIIGNRNTTFRSLDLFLDQWLRLALSKGPNWVRVTSPLQLKTDTDAVSVTSCFYSLEYWTMGKVQKPSSSVCYTPLLWSSGQSSWPQIQRTRFSEK
jgi:hypothetical protein